MEIFVKVIRWIFYLLVIACGIFFVMYKFSDPVNEEYFRYFMYCGFSAIGLSLIRFVLRFMY